MELEPNLATAEEFKNQGNDEFKKKNYSKAIELYTKAIQNNTQEPNYYGNRAACYLALKKYNKCLEDCEEALKLNENFVKALRRKGLSLLQLGKFQEALSTFDYALKIESDAQLKKERAEAADALADFTYLEKYCEADEYTRAIIPLNSLLNRYPDIQGLQMRQVEIKAKLGSIDEAQKLFTHNSGTWDALPIELHYLRAVTLLYAGRSEDARKTLITCMQLDPDNVKVKNLLKKAKQIEVLKEKGNEALKEKQYEQCIPIFTDALQIDPCNKKINALCYSNRGLAKLRLKNYKGAVEDLNKAIDFDDKYFKSYMRRAEARQELGDFDLAVGDYNEAGKFGGDTNETKRLIKDCQKKAKQAKRKDYYSILGVPKDADDKTIKKAYKKLAVQWHPDKHIEQADKEEAQKKFKDIGESYSVLMDPKKRQVFDDGGDPEGPGGMDGGSGGMDPSAMFQTMFSGGGGFPFGGGGGFPFGGGNARFGGQEQSYHTFFH